ncbi:ParA family protein [Streptomyces sp. NPDC053048]|uniref:ParA family protein n=1 Tax=Streptomyces sp. NPDC053048 TaxID=3365694 RepID=UPI0037D06D72
MTALPPHVSIANHKGGVGKTGTAQGLAVAAAEADHRVLVVDMDAQGNLTRRLRAQVSADPDERQRNSLASVLERPARGEIERVLVPCGYGGIYSDRIRIAPAHLDLELLPRSAAQAASERRLLKALAGVVVDFDLVLIDCPPNLLSHQIDIAWTASDVLLLPCEGEYDAVEAARRIAERVTADRDILNPDLAIAGMIVNRFRTSLSVHHQRADEMAKIVGAEGVCPTRLPELVAIKNMAELARPLAEIDGQGKAMAALFTDVYKWSRERIETVMKGAA